MDSELTAEQAPIEVTRSGAVACIELTRPNIFNALSSELWRAVEAALTGFEADREVRVLTIRARGKHFCTGADLDEIRAVRSDSAQLTRFLETGHRVLRKLERSRLPVVAGVHGLCLAGGLELTLACDIVIAGRSARFGDQHARYGLVPGWGGSQRLPRLVGMRRALDLMLSARWIDAEQALGWGLITSLVEDEALPGALDDCGQSLATRSPEGLRVMKQLARTGIEEPLDDALAREIREAATALASESAAEGLAAFAERREPVFDTGLD